MRKVNNEKIVRIFIYICLFLSTFNIPILTINMLNFQVSLFRIFIAITIPLALIFKRDELFKINNSFKYYILFMFVWFLYAIISLLWVMNKYEWFQTVYFISLGLLSLYVFSKYIINKNYLLNSLIAFSVSTFMHILIGLNELFFNNYWFIKEEYLDKYSYNNWPVSSFTNTNNYAFYLSLCICVFLFIINLSNNLIIRRSCIVLSVFSFILICATNSRGVILAILLGLTFLLLNKHVFFNKAKQFKILCLSILSISLIAITVVTIIGFLNIDYFQNPSNSNSIRLNLSFNSIYFTFKSYFIGVGAGNFESYLISNVLFDTAGIVNSHNWFFEILVEYGLAIFIGYIYFVYTMYKSTQKNNNFFNYITILFLIIFIVGSISPSSIASMEWMWLLISLVICGLNICNEVESDENININKKHNYNRWSTKSSNISS